MSKDREILGDPRIEDKILSKTEKEVILDRVEKKNNEFPPSIDSGLVGSLLFIYYMHLLVEGNFIDMDVNMTPKGFDLSADFVSEGWVLSKEEIYKELPPHVLPVDSKSGEEIHMLCLLIENVQEYGVAGMRKRLEEAKAKEEKADKKPWWKFW